MSSSSWVIKKCMLRDSIDRRLPDDILLSIVSRLPVIEAGRASVLGRRWRYLWTFNPHLNFDGSKVLAELKEFGLPLEPERNRFVRCVNGVLDKLHPNTTIDEFRITFDLGRGHASDINKWLQFAFARRVKRLELNFPDSATGGSKGKYTFPNICERLRILPRGISTCESLISLTLVGLYVTEEVLLFFISNCPFLEELRVKLGRVKKLTASCPATRLRHLEIVNCGIESLEICAPNLISFTLFGAFSIPIALKHVASLTSLSVGAMVPAISILYMMEISGCLSQLETLTLHSSMLSEHMLESPVLPRLKKLVLDVCTSGNGSLLLFASLINSAPLLREIVVKLTWNEVLIQRTRRTVKGIGQKHQCLEVLQIEGFAGFAIDVELAEYILENAVSLKKTVLDFGCPLSGQEAGTKRNTRMAMAREGVRLIKEKLSDGIELVVR